MLRGSWLMQGSAGVAVDIAAVVKCEGKLYHRLEFHYATGRQGKAAAGLWLNLLLLFKGT